MNYYCLVAGLPDIQAEETKSVVSLFDLKSDLLNELSSEDVKLLRLLFAKYDNENLLTYLQNQESDLNPAGNLNSQDWKELIALMKEFEKPVDTRLLPYIHTYYTNQSDDSFGTEAISREDYLSALYYEYAMKSPNKFVNKWFEYNLNINNLLTAIACRKYGFDIKNLVIGNNEVASVLRQSNARDFGLTGLFDDFETILRIAEESDLMEREKKIDALKWAWLEEHTFFNFFSVEKVLAFVLKIEMIERWKMLSIDKGEQIFRELLAELKQGVQFENLK